MHDDDQGGNMSANESLPVPIKRSWRHRVYSRLEIFWNRYKLHVYVLTLILFFMILFFWENIFIDVFPGQAGVKWKRFKGTELTRTYKNGLQVLWPWDRLYIYDIRVHELHETIEILTSNGLSITVHFSVRYHPKLAYLPLLHETVGPEFTEKVVRPEVISALRQVLGNYRPDEIYAKDEEGLLAEVMEILDREITDKFIHLDELLIKELTLPEFVQEAIQKKLVEEQNALAYEFILAQEEAEKERRLIMAEGIRLFEEISQISILRWYGIQATESLAKSNNTKVVIIGTDAESLPVILNTEK